MGDIVTRFDDRDPRIQYLGIWGNSGTALDYLNTTTFTIYAGSGVSFNFTGTGVSVYGTIGHTGFGLAPVSNYTIDSSVPYQFNATQTAEDQHQQLFFRATGLVLGQHTLVITNELENDVLTLDYLEVETTGDGSSNSSSFTTPTSSSSTATTTQSATITAFQTSSQSTATHAGPPIGAVIGGAIAGSIIISLMLFACFCARRRRHRRNNLPPPDSLSSPQLDMSHAPAGSSSGITPFIIGDPSGSFSSPSLGGYATRGYGHGVDGDAGSSVPEGVVRHSKQVPFSAGGREKSHSDLPPRYTASSEVS